MGENLGFKQGMIYLALFGFLLAATAYTAFLGISEPLAYIFAILLAILTLIALWFAITEMKAKSP